MMPDTSIGPLVTCPHCADDLDRPDCHTCGTTGLVPSCCDTAEAEVVYPAVDDRDWRLFCRAHGCSTCRTVHVGVPACEVF